MGGAVIGSLKCEFAILSLDSMDDNLAVIFLSLCSFCLGGVFSYHVFLDPDPSFANKG